MDGVQRFDLVAQPAGSYSIGIEANEAQPLMMMNAEHFRSEQIVL